MNFADLETYEAIASEFENKQGFPATEYVFNKNWTTVNQWETDPELKYEVSENNSITSRVDNYKCPAPTVIEMLEWLSGYYAVSVDVKVSIGVFRSRNKPQFLADTIKSILEAK